MQRFIHHKPPRLEPPMTRARLVALSVLLTATAAAHAGEIYTKLGFPGLMLGFAQPINSQFGLRADLATLGDRDDRYNEEGIAYDGALKTTRLALLADWHPMGGSFRLTAGLTSNQYKLDLRASGAGGTLTIGNTTYTTTAADQFRVLVKFPSTAPYLGVGWGHGLGQGFRWSFDIGASIGRAKVSYEITGPAASTVSQNDIDAELAELRDGVGKVRAVPQLTFGVGWSF
jgi:hypothetical protein